MQDILLSQATANLCKMGFETVQDSDGKTLLNGTMTATARWIKADGTSAVAAGTFTQPDSTNAGGARFYQPTAAELNTMGAALLRVSGTVGGVTFRTRTLQISVTALDKYDAVRAGLTALPNAAAEAAGGLYTRGTGAGQINQPANGMIDVNAVRHLGTAYVAPTTAGVPRVDVKFIEDNVITATSINTNAIDSDAVSAGAAGEIAVAVWDALVASHVTVGTFGKKLGDLAAGGDATAANQATIIAHVDTLEAQIATILGLVDTEIAAIQAALVDIGGLVHRNSLLDNVVRDAGGFMLTARLRVFANAAALAAATLAAADNADGEVRRYTLTGTPDGSGRLVSFKAAQIL